MLDLTSLKKKNQSLLVLVEVLVVLHLALVVEAVVLLQLKALRQLEAPQHISTMDIKFTAITTIHHHQKKFLT